MAKELRRIDIETLPNGYALTIGEHNYMYHNEKDLLEGFMYHVCLGEKPYCSKEFIKDFLATAIAWKTGDGDLVKKNIELTNENKRLSGIIQTNKKVIERLKDKIAAYDKGGKENMDDDEEEEE